MRTLWLAWALAALPLAAADSGPWQPLEFLVGDWRGEGGGGPGQGAGGFSFTWDLQKTVLVRRNYAEYPAQQGRPAARQDDLTVVYREGSALRADYYDNEGHIIRYRVSSPAAGVAEFLSEAAEVAPRYRLTYRKTGAESVGIQFEVAPPGKPFATYIQATARRK
jgi:hypothetical protein